MGFRDNAQRVCILMQQPTNHFVISSRTLFLLLYPTILSPSMNSLDFCFHSIKNYRTTINVVEEEALKCKIWSVTGINKNTIKRVFIINNNL